jgi:hypothetical protein
LICLFSSTACPSWEIAWVAEAAMALPSVQVEVPDLVGLEVRQARRIADSFDLFITSGSPDGPPVGALTWPGRWVVITQNPSPGTIVPRASWVVVEFEQRGGGGAGDREPRRPDPPLGTILEHSLYSDATK